MSIKTQKVIPFQSNCRSTRTNKDNNHNLENTDSNIDKNQIETNSTLKRFSKNTLTISANLLPALVFTEISDEVSESIGAKDFFKYIKPVGNQFSRYLLIEGITKENIYKPIAESISALGLLKIQNVFDISNTLLRPVSTVLFFLIETFEDIKDLLKSSGKSYVELSSENQDLNTLKNNLSWESISQALLITELQLNIVVPIVRSLRKYFLKNINSAVFGSIGRTLFNIPLLSSGFTLIGELASKGLKYVSKNPRNNSIKPVIAGKIYWQ